MDIDYIMANATLKDLCELHDKEGYDFIIEDGKIAEVVINGSGETV